MINRHSSFCHATRQQSDLEQLVVQRTAQLVETVRRLEDAVQFQHQAEQDGQCRQQLMADILDTLLEAVWMSNADHLVTYINPHARRLAASYSSDGTFTFDMLASVEQLPFFSTLKQFYQQACQTLLPVPFNNVALPWHGATLYLSGTMTPVLGAARYNGIVCIMRDTTLEYQHAESSKDFQTRMILANKAKALSLLVSGIAHEVNNPNNSIMLGCELLESYWHSLYHLLQELAEQPGVAERIPAEILEQKTFGLKIIRSIHCSTQRIATVISNLRDYAGRRSAEGSELNLNSLAETVVSILHHQIRGLSDDFSLELASSLPVVIGNPQQIMQVMINLIMNALQALPERRCAVRLRTSYDHAAGQVVVAVVDAGEGIKDEHLAYIYEPFFSTRCEQGGTGLGLAICKYIMQEHDGSLQHFTPHGGGTCAEMRLPVGGGAGV